MKKIANSTFFILILLVMSHVFSADETNSDDDFTFYPEWVDPINVCNSQEDKENEEPKRRALPAPFASPPFPSGEYQGSPLIGIPPSDTVYPLTKLIYKLPCADALKKSRVKAYGWINGSGNLSTCKHSNSPSSYWLVPNKFELDQFVFRLER